MARSLIACALRAVLVFLRATYVLSRSSSWQLAGSRIEGWHSIRITGDSGISLYGDVFGSTFTALQGAVPCTQVEVLGATYPAFMLPLAENSTSSTFSIVAAVSSSGGQPLSAGQSNGLLASLRGMDLTLSSSQGEAAAARTALPPSAWGNSSLPLSLGDASRTAAPLPHLRAHSRLPHLLFPLRYPPSHALCASSIPWERRASRDLRRAFRWQVGISHV